MGGYANVSEAVGLRPHHLRRRILQNLDFVPQSSLGTDIRLIAVSHGNTNIFHLVFDLVFIFDFQFYLTRSNARPAQIQCFGEGK